MSFFLGAYATSPCGSHWDQAAETAYWQGLRRLSHLRGLEYPFAGKLHPHDEAWALANLDPAWDLVLTLLPGTMDRLEKDPRFGLASEDEEGRRAALDFTKLAASTVARLNDTAGRRRVVAVELHSSPRPLGADQELAGSAPRPLGADQESAGSAPRRGVPRINSSAVALARSLSEIAGWDWQDAALTLEHCDAFRPDLPPIKGFLTFEEEIEALRLSDAPIGLCINWGRSALEARDAARPLAQIVRAREEGLLTGIMFSGCSGEDTPWGSWQDSHMPHAPAPGLEFSAPGSLMTAQAIVAALTAAGDSPLFIGGKITARPTDAGIEQRLGFNRDLLTLLAACSAG